MEHKTWDGCVYPVGYDEDKCYELREKFVSRDTDIFIATYPKSGTTWTSRIIDLLVKGGKSSDLNAASAPHGGSLCLQANVSADEENSFYFSLQQIEDLPNPRVIKTHDRAGHWPTEPIVAGEQGPAPKVIYVSRNPKDVAVSMYKHASRPKPPVNSFGIKTSKHYTGTWDEFLDLYASGTVYFGSWFEHNLKWWEAAKTNKNILFVFYEDMQKDPSGEVRRIAEFCNLECSDEILADVLEKSSISSTRKAINKHRKGAVGKGGIGGWREHFTDEQSARFDEIYRTQLQGSGLQHDFGDAPAPASDGTSYIWILVCALVLLALGVAGTVIPAMREFIMTSASKWGENRGVLVACCFVGFSFLLGSMMRSPTPSKHMSEKNELQTDAGAKL